MRLSIILFLVFISVADCFCQNRNSVWCFGDSAGIDFNNINNPIPIETGLRTRGSCVSISDSSGQLLFYANTRAAMAGFTTTLVYDKTNNIMLNGTNIFGNGWYYELIIIPMPGNDSLYYLFSIGVTSVFGLQYSVINMKANNGLGAVILKNIQIQSFEQVDCLNAIKHGNGRDWWLLFRKSDYSTFGSNNNWYSYLITPDSIQNFSVQSIGAQNRTNSGQICFTPLGDKLAFINLLGVIELFDFDRCSGLLSNPITIEQDAGMNPYPMLWSCAFSPDASKLYVTTDDTLSFLYQYDLNAANIAASKDTLWSINYPQYAIGGLKLAPDNKIYLSNIYHNGIQFSYPYEDSVYNMYNMNLSVINQPDSLDATCDFQPYSFYLGGKRTYLGLPNNPDYEMPRLQGSACDTIQWTSVQNIEQAKGVMYVTYLSDWQKLYVNTQGLKGRSFKVSVYDMVGNVIYTEEGKLSSQYFTKDLNMAAFAKGMYIVNFVTDKERLVKKFIKE